LSACKLVKMESVHLPCQKWCVSSSAMAGVIVSRVSSDVDVVCDVTLLQDPQIVEDLKEERNREVARANLLQQRLEDMRQEAALDRQRFSVVRCLSLDADLRSCASD